MKRASMGVFLFQTGSIRSFMVGWTWRKRFRFYSKLVRLEGIKVVGYCTVDKRFYSKLVRLEGCLCYHVGMWVHVSIPNWFD